MVRVGGHQAAHNVVLPDGTHHTFSQLSSGTFAGASTVLSKNMLVNPGALFVELDYLRRKGYDMLKRVVVQRGALITTPLHIAANQQREAMRGDNRHGSCGVGIGETVVLAQPGLPASLYAAAEQRPTRR